MPTLNEEFVKNPFKFFKTYPVLPPGQAEQALVNVKTLIKSGDLKGKTDTGDLATLEHLPETGRDHSVHRLYPVQNAGRTQCRHILSKENTDQ